MKKILLFTMAAAVLMASSVTFGAQAPGDALAVVERAVTDAGYAFEVRTALMAKAREALEQGISPDDVTALVQKGAEQKMGGQSTTLFLSIAVETKRQGLPERPILNRIHQGIAKGVPPDKVLMAAGQVKERLGAAAEVVDKARSQGLKSGNADERDRAVVAAAVALETGFPTDDIGKIGGLAAQKKRALSQFARAVESMANLKEAGMPRNLAVQTARQFVILDYSEKGMARQEIEMFSMRRSGWSWQDAFSRLHTGGERGTRDMGSPLQHESGAGGVAGSGGALPRKRL
ncbi:MAG: hypothetical protein A2X56_04680 [Nitrospirae bacterium GWC2_57_13]|jgi:hypothetical protein|nr:MAG: hypothetical protein A2X56_04680 [Nitrospirae bacterium GWC2_57_13]OGW44221.1 MAG: hypothetical protein A2X57_11715 [Nitrospirae bacterium GWD2_57_8]